MKKEEKNRIAIEKLIESMNHSFKILNENNSEMVKQHNHLCGVCEILAERIEKLEARNNLTLKPEIIL